MTKINIGSNCSIDLNTLIETKLLVIGNTGSGKSYAVRRVLEESYGKIPFIVLDVEGEFVTLREKFECLIVGEDIKINLQSAHLLPKALIENKVSTIIDLSILKKPERIQYVKKFLEALMQLPKEYWQPFLIVIGEAHYFAGQQEKQDSTWAVIDVCARGRKRGYTAILDTQRIAKLHKDAAAEFSNVMVGRTYLDIDMKRSAEILGFTSKQDTLKLRELETGEFYAFGEAMRPRYVHTIKVNKAHTTHPKLGVKFDTKVSPPSNKIKAMLSKLVDLPKEAEQELRTINDLKAEIFRLKREIGTNNAAIDAQKLERIKQQAFQKGMQEMAKKDSQAMHLLKKEANEVERLYLQETSKLKLHYEQKYKEMEKYALSLKSILSSIGNLIAKAPMESKKPLSTFTPKPLPVTHHKPAYKEEGNGTPKLPFKGRNDGDVKWKQVHYPDDGRNLKGGAMRMLKAIAMFDKISREKTKTLAGISAASTFSAYLQQLKGKGWVEENNKKLRVTEEGMKNAGEIKELPTDTESLIEMWSDFLKEGAVRMLRILVDNYPHSITRSELSSEAGIQAASTFSTYLQDLRRNGLVEVNGSDVTAAKELFGED